MNSNGDGSLNKASILQNQRVPKIKIDPKAMNNSNVIGIWIRLQKAAVFESQIAKLSLAFGALCCEKASARLQTIMFKDCKAFPKSRENVPKMVPLTVLRASGGHLGLHRAFYSKTVARNNSILGSLWGAFGALCCPKASATLYHFTFLRTIFDQKPEKSHPKSHSEIVTEKASKNNAKRLPE